MFTLFIDLFVYTQHTICYILFIWHKWLTTSYKWIRFTLFQYLFNEVEHVRQLKEFRHMLLSCFYSFRSKEEFVEVFAPFFVLFNPHNYFLLLIWTRDLFFFVYLTTKDVYLHKHPRGAQSWWIFCSIFSAHSCVWFQKDLNFSC